MHTCEQTELKLASWLATGSPLSSSNTFNDKDGQMRSVWLSGATTPRVYERAWSRWMSHDRAVLLITPKPKAWSRWMSCDRAVLLITPSRKDYR